VTAVALKENKKGKNLAHMQCKSIRGGKEAFPWQIDFRSGRALGQEGRSSRVFRGGGDQKTKFLSKTHHGLQNFVTGKRA